MVTRDGFAKILDFGVAKLAPVGFEASKGHRRRRTRETEAGTVLGTVGYMSPEQASGQPVDFRSDQFSFGAILYEMMTGRRAFARPTPAQTLTAIIESEPDPAPKSAAARFPESLTWILERCLAKEPRGAVCRDERSGARSSRPFGIASRSLPSVGPAAARSRGRRLSSTALAATAVAVAGIAVAAFLAGGRAQARRDREAPPPKRTTLTFRRGIVHAARFAPDGQTIVYSASWDGKPGRSSRRGWDRPSPVRSGCLPAESRRSPRRAKWQLLLGCSDERCGGTLARVPLAGGTPREIVEEVIAADWSPDGRDLAVILLATRETVSSIPSGRCCTRGGGLLSSVARFAARRPRRVPRASEARRPPGHPDRRRSGRPEARADRRVGQPAAAALEPDGRGGLLLALGRRRDAGSRPFGPHAKRLVDPGPGRRLAGGSFLDSGKLPRELPKGDPGSLTGRGGGTESLLARRLDGRRLLRRRPRAAPFRHPPQSRPVGRRSLHHFPAPDGRLRPDPARRRQGARAVARREMGARFPSDAEAASASASDGSGRREAAPDRRFLSVPRDVLSGRTADPG